MFFSMLRIKRMFHRGNVCVVGLRGNGKDMLMSNIVVRRKLPYISNTPYDDKLHIQFVPKQFDCGQNTYDNFINGTIKQYVFPYEDDTDLYISDAGVYFPAQYCNELNRKYGYFSTFMALSRHLGCNVHFNVQNLNRCWDKIREQSDQYIMVRWCKVLFGKLVIQRVWIYEKYQSAVDRVPPYRVPRPALNRDRLLRWQLDKQNYIIQHGKIKPMTLVYFNRSNYNTRIFKEMLENGMEE